MSAATLMAVVAGVLLTLAAADAASAFTALRMRPAWRLARRRPAAMTERLGDCSGAVRRALTRHGVVTPAGLRERLAAAGNTRPGAAEQLMALKCALACSAAVVLLPGTLDSSGLGALLRLAVVPVAAFLAPDFLVRRRARARARLLRAQAPELLDRVRLAADAGMNPDRVLLVAASRGDGLLAAEVRAALAATRLGLSRDQALDALCSRCPVPEVYALAAALRRSAIHGAPLAGAAAALAATARAERARRIHDRAQQAAPKIQLVVALLLVPAALLLVAAGMLAGLR